LASSVLYMSVSLNGFIAGPNEGWDAELAAGDKHVSVHGAAVAQLALAAGVLDELELYVVPVLLGQGRRRFDGLDPEHIELERAGVLEGEHGVTHLRDRVRHGA
jgi:dihydrofolate reductase